MSITCLASSASIAGEGGPRRRRRAALAALCVVSIAGGVLAAASGSASAAVDPAVPEFRAPLGVTYSLQRSNTSSGVEPLVTVHGNAPEDGALVDTWSRTFEDATAGGNIVNANQLWEFVPAADNTGGTIFTGYGWLKNRRTGKCLQVHGASTEEAAWVNQWTCVPGADNDMWQAVSVDGSSYGIQVKHSGAYLGVSVPGCNTWNDGNGDYLYAMSQFSACTAWREPQLESYRFATARIEVPAPQYRLDTGVYRCLPGYQLRVRGVTQEASGVWTVYRYTSLSTGNTEVSPPRSEVSRSGAVYQDFATSIAYRQSSNQTQIGQVMLYCDPK